ncbi:MAG TPA: hypothetical protein VLE91_05015 [Candidatus Saccharimonadales bacterium]|nr:hypothetical protein [Candidatus Saccharimonadales bacterium]
MQIPKKVKAHFKIADPILYEVIVKVGQMQELPHRKNSDYFLDLVDIILSQQLSGKVADVIITRFKKLFTKEEITPQTVLKHKDDELRAIGVSYQKIKYIKDLSEKITKKELDLASIRKMKDEDVILELIKVKGIGKWTAEMFLIFTLGREDVFSHGDLGLNNAIKNIYKLEKHSQEIVEQIVSKWSPYKSYASRILWKSLDNR